MPEIRVTKDGPYLVSGELPIAKATIGANAEGASISWEWGSPLPAQKNAALCRCGHSGHKPYCDGTHAKVGFDGTETASRKPYREQAKLIEGPVLSLTDAEGLCAFARFCDPNGQVWRLVQETDRTKAREDFVRQTCDCLRGGSSPGTMRRARLSSQSFHSRSAWSRIRPRIALARYGCAVASP